MNLTSALALMLMVLAADQAQSQNVGDDLVRSTVVESDAGLLDITLTLEYGNHATAAHTMFNTRLFNGTLPGPTLKVRAGDKMRILFKNNLIEQAGQNMEENTFSFPDTSNLHFHGAHVSGELPSDDVTLKVQPGNEYQYETDFPGNHMPGTHWIHPHVHGSGALQVGGGAAMAIIVEDPEGYLPAEIENTVDVLLFVQYMDLSQLETVAEDSGDSMLDIQTNVGFDRNFRIVNGQFQPTVHIQPGEWQRWRIAYASWLRDPLDFTIDGNACEMHLLAKDGVYIQDFPRQITLAPIPTAGRADIMVRCQTAGEYTVSDFGGTLMHIKVDGDGIASDALQSWTPVIPEYLLDLTNTPASNDCSCDTQFQLGNACTGSGHCVNGLSFDPDRFLHTIVLGSVVERELRGIDAHPYHQHVYPFQIVDGVEELTGDQEIYFQTGDWHDVLMIEDTNSITMRYLPNVHLGRLMLHCHRLDHEDQGMMAQEEVVDPSIGQCTCEANGGRITASPVEAPTTAPPTGTPTIGPTRTPNIPVESPTNGPTGAPTVAPADVSGCADSETWVFTDPSGNSRDCEDIARNLRCNIRGDGGDTRAASEACPVTCGTCTASTSAPTGDPTTSPTPGLRGSSTSDPTPGPTAEPTSAPVTSPPTPFPTKNPSTSLPTSTKTASPTSRPTVPPTTDTTVSPTPGPTPSPTDAPVNIPGCVDSTTWRGLSHQGMLLGCVRVAIRPDQRCNIIGKEPDTRSALEACPVTCGGLCEVS